MTKKDISNNKQTNNALIWTLTGLALVVALAFLAHWIKLQVYNIKELPLGIPGKALEYPLWAAIIGILANFLLKATGIYARLKPGFRTELFLKVGLVLLGATISMVDIIKGGFGAILQGIIMITCVYFFSWWVAGKFKLSDTLRAVMSCAVSICGVSAAIAAAGAVQAKKQEVTYITTLVILVALPLMVLAPMMAGWMGMPQAVAGAWFGGNVDTTAAVVGAGTLYGEQAQKIATLVKTTQNAFIGVVAFLLALYFSTVVDKKAERPKPIIIWQRFPKFVLGFIAASILFSLLAGPDKTPEWVANGLNSIKAMKDWAFCIAFVSMGLDMSLKDIKSMGWKPVVVYLIVTVFNTILALAVSWAIFGWLFPA
ncbi:MAG TPA: putative sulfate exporter family transporter [Anaerolineaceae bacterium]|nr:putative sulfate exporter family transporter [Anaerolineaceae bacterium]HPN51695.1 putative sulfate exporter family transporter [Anaerolineaceae bacterium]